MEDGATIRAEFHGNDIAVSSRDPLIGTLDLTSSTDTTVEVMLDRYSAEALLSVIVQFLAQGQGGYAPSSPPLPSN